MALVSLYDPYEWFDPEQGRQGVLVHTSQFDFGTVHPRYVVETTWPEVWEEFDADKGPSEVHP